ncbi:N-lysine methyltransferase KMT5A-like isoform X1 [Hydra vulgaris]|uniref:N-lysine methyltransferase KMT5A-like isoform X1 n=1 Tax=Hydra vulgaris TaxID=6087 RepID=A0ABM4BG39_HYDVU
MPFLFQEKNLPIINDVLLLQAIKNNERPDTCILSFLYKNNEKDIKKITKAIKLGWKSSPEERLSMKSLLKAFHSINEKGSEFISKRRLSPIETAKSYIEMEKDPENLYKKLIDKTKGFGVFSFEKIYKGQFIAQYRGDLVPKKEMNDKIKHYEETNAGSYVYDFIHNNIEYSIDATLHLNYVGRYINDSKYFPKAVMKKVLIKNTPSLCLFALKDIEPNEEILYFYGVDNLSWHPEEFKRKQQKRNKSKVNHYVKMMYEIYLKID